MCMHCVCIALVLLNAFEMSSILVAEMMHMKKRREMPHPAKGYAECLFLHLEVEGQALRVLQELTRQQEQPQLDMLRILEEACASNRMALELAVQIVNKL